MDSSYNCLFSPEIKCNISTDNITPELFSVPCAGLWAKEEFQIPVGSLLQEGRAILESLLLIALSSAPRTVIGIGWEQNKYSLDRLMNSAQLYSLSS